MILLYLFRDSSLTDSKIKEMMGFSSVTSASHYRKQLESRGLIKRYALDIDWEKLGYKTKFLILVEAEDKDTLHQVAKDHVLAAEEYAKRVGEIILVPIPFGKVVLKDVMTFFGELGIITGIAPSDDAAKMYAEVYLKERYPRAKITINLIKDVTVKDFLLQSEFIKAYKSILNITPQDLERLQEFRKKFPWERFK